MRRLMLVMCAGALVFGAPAGASNFCGGSVQQISIPALGDLYVDDRGATEADVWIYRETNGMQGLQRGGTAVHGQYEDHCFDHDQAGTPYPPDMLLF